MPNPNSRKAEHGSTLVEFAAVLTILLTLTFGMIDFGRYVYAVSVIRSAAQEGARAGVNLDGEDDLETIVRAAAESKMIALDTSKALVTPTQDGEITEVYITYEFEFITPLLAAATTSGTIEIDGSASMIGPLNTTP